MAWQLGWAWSDPGRSTLPCESAKAEHLELVLIIFSIFQRKTGYILKLIWEEAILVHMMSERILNCDFVHVVCFSKLFFQKHDPAFGNISNINV